MRAPRYMYNWQEEYQKKLRPLDEIASFIQSNTRIFSAGWSGDPISLIRAISARRATLENVEFCSNNSLGLPFNEPENDGHLINNQWFLGRGARKEVQVGHGTYTPHHFGKQTRDMEGLEIDYGIMIVSPPDSHGFMSFGTMAAYSRYLVDHAKTVIVQVNENQPYIYGDTLVHVSEVDYICEANDPILTIPVVPVNQQSSAIAEYISEFIEDGSTLQLGIGAIPNAIAKLLVNKHNLGIHSEMFTENIIDLMEAGAVNNSQKTMHRFKSVACFAGGSEKLYKWLNRNPFVEFYPVSYTNDPVIIARQKKMVSINATMCVDLSGQACSESIGPKQYSGVGGQMDFNLGASMCPDGKAFLVVNSTAKTKDGVISTIVPTLAQGSFVSTGRNDIDYVVTEYGVAKLRGKTMRQRAEQLIAIAHPDYRKELLKEANRLFFI